MAAGRIETVWVVIIGGELAAVCRSESGATARANTYLSRNGGGTVERATASLWLYDGDETITVQRRELCA